MRYNPDYFYELVRKSHSHNIVVGNVYTDKTLSPWDRLMTLLRKKIYYPYYNHPFKDIELDYDDWKRFKNKGGGAVMLVLKSYYLSVAPSMKMGKDVSDDMSSYHFPEHSPRKFLVPAETFSVGSW